MTPKEKADELVEKYHNFLRKVTDTTTLSNMWWKDASRLAFMFVDGIMVLDVWENHHEAEYGYTFWEEVKREIMNMI